jgi:hypothetical protein
MKNYLLRRFQPLRQVNLTCPSHHQTESVDQSVATSDVTEPSQSTVKVNRVSTSRDIVTRSEGTTISYSLSSSVTTTGREKGVVAFLDKTTTKETGFSSTVMNRVALSTTSKEETIPSSTSTDDTSSSEEEDSFFSKEFYDDFNKKGYSVVAATPSNRPMTKTDDADYDYDDGYDEEQAEGVDDANDEEEQMETAVAEEEKTMSQVVRSVSNPDYLEVGGTVLEGSSALHTPPRHVAGDDVISGRSAGSRRQPSWGTAVLVGLFLLGMCIFCT